MSTPAPGTVTQVLEAVGRGDDAARSRLWTILHDELHQLARRKLAHEPDACRLGSSSLVHEAFIRLTAGQRVEFANRRHFFAAAAEAMRRILVDESRKRLAQKHGGGRQPAVLEHEPIDDDRDPSEILGIDEALAGLAKRAPRSAKVVEYRYFAELTVDETAEVLGVSARTVDSDWQFARAWLRRELSGRDKTRGPDPEA